MSDAYETLREMLDGVPDDAQVYVEEREIVTEWPGITAGTFRALLAEIAGFEAMWEQRETAHEAALGDVMQERDKHKDRADFNFRTFKEVESELIDARAQLATAKRESRHECLAWHNEGIGCADCRRVIYPATPSGEGVNCADVAGCDGKCCATPSPEAREVPSDVMLRVERESLVRITPADAKRIVAMGQEVE